ncbi:glycerol-3-phosphate 1-O-acyltransferase PlsY [Mailhella sp.]|uniref:glycerol-3-phosphate 1-O-acyltransferase PlsY n=1 Tax=Mailhella sp. TaxID=1981029 RepID=UPI0040644EB4
MSYLILVLCLVFAFFLGAVPFGLVIAKTFKGIDPRKAGSGNIGSTNVARLCGMSCGLLTLFCDIMKGVLPVLVAVCVLPSQFQQSLVALAAVMGHIKSPFLGFKGGKGVATTIGALIPLAFLPLLCSVACFFVVVFITRYVSLSSMTMAVALVVFYAVFGYWELMPLGVVLAVMIIWAHRANIKRLLRGEESRFVLKK